MDYHVTLSQFPTTLAELTALPEAELTQPKAVVAMTVAALNAYEKNPQESIAMLNFLKGPQPLSNYEQQFLKERLGGGKAYIARSYIEGATPKNNYEPSQPYTVHFQDSVAQIADQNYKKYDVFSGGADSPRPVTLRLKPSTGQWFMWEQILIVDIRIPEAQDPWA